MRNLDEVFDIYQSFLDLVIRDFGYFETAKTNETGKERMLLALDIGFYVELTNQANVENSANLRCWWHHEADAVEIECLDQLIEKFGRL